MSKTVPMHVHVHVAALVLVAFLAWSSATTINPWEFPERYPEFKPSSPTQAKYYLRVSVQWDREFSEHIAREGSAESYITNHVIPTLKRVYKRDLNIRVTADLLGEIPIFPEDFKIAMRSNGGNENQKTAIVRDELLKNLKLTGYPKKKYGVRLYLTAQPEEVYPNYGISIMGNPFLSAWKLGEFEGVCDPATNAVMINAGLIFAKSIPIDPTKQNRFTHSDAFVLTVLHEIGHTLGLMHDEMDPIYFSKKPNAKTFLKKCAPSGWIMATNQGNRVLPAFSSCSQHYWTEKIKNPKEIACMLTSQITKDDSAIPDKKGKQPLPRRAQDDIDINKKKLTSKVERLLSSSK